MREGSYDDVAGETPPMDIEGRDAIADGALKRLDAIDFRAFFSTSEDAFHCVAHTLDDGAPDAEIVGICICGSTLTDSFRPGESDLDVYYLLSEPSPHGAAFSRSLLDDQFIYTARLDRLLGDQFDGIDPIGAIGIDNYDAYTYEPRVIIRRTDGAPTDSEGPA